MDWLLTSFGCLKLSFFCLPRLSRYLQVGKKRSTLLVYLIGNYYYSINKSRLVEILITADYVLVACQSRNSLDELLTSHRDISVLILILRLISNVKGVTPGWRRHSYFPCQFYCFCPRFQPFISPEETMPLVL